MKIGLASYRVENKNTEFSISQIEQAMIKASETADLLCFGEAVLQGFDSLCWNYENDKEMAVSTDSETMNRLKNLTKQYGIGIAFGYIEKDGEILYSSYAVIDAGNIVHNYRRISRGWKEFTRTDDHYREGNDTAEFSFRGRTIMVGYSAICGIILKDLRLTAFLSGPCMSTSVLKTGTGKSLNMRSRLQALQMMF